MILLLHLVITPLISAHLLKQLLIFMTYVLMMFTSLVFEAKITTLYIAQRSNPSTVKLCPWSDEYSECVDASHQLVLVHQPDRYEVIAADNFGYWTIHAFGATDVVILPPYNERFNNATIDYENQFFKISCKISKSGRLTTLKSIKVH